MTARALFRMVPHRQVHNFLMMPLTPLILIGLAAGTFVSYLLWPTWKNAPEPVGPPELPITIAGVVFNVPTLAVRAAVQRQPGPHERVDLAFLWPSLLPQTSDAKLTAEPVSTRGDSTAPATADTTTPLFVTIAGFGGLMPPEQRLRTIYPHYIEAQAETGPDGLVVLAFRGGTPYAGEDLIYSAGEPERFFTLCTRQTGVMPGTCIQERTLDAAQITLRFPREWLDDWQGLASGFDRLIAQLHPQIGDTQLRSEEN